MYNAYRTLQLLIYIFVVSIFPCNAVLDIPMQFPCYAVLHKWGVVPSAACALCRHPTETQGHIQCLCPALKEARIRAHHNMAQMLWKGIKDSTREWTIVTEQTVAGLPVLQQPEEQIDAWQRAWDKVDNLHLDSGR